MDESMKANAPEKIYVVDATFPDYVDFDGSPINTKRIDDHDIEYIRLDTFIEKAVEFLYNYNQKQVLKHGVKATLGCGEYTINVDEFRKYMKGE